MEQLSHNLLKSQQKYLVQVNVTVVLYVLAVVVAINLKTLNYNALFFKAVNWKLP